MTNLLIGTVAILAFVFIIIAIAVRRAAMFDRTPIETAASYLLNIPEISWMVIVRNRVYLGFNKRVNDMGAICRGAALNCSRVCQTGVHVYAVDGYQADWRKSKKYCKATARQGKITQNNGDR